MKTYEMLYIDTINDSILESADNMNNETMILFRDMTAMAPMTQIKPITWIARYEHVLHDGIVHSMNKGECSGIVRDYSTRSLWRWERIEAHQVTSIEVTHEDDDDYGFVADVTFPWGEVIHNRRFMVYLDDWQQIILDDLGDGKSSGRFEDDLGTVWKWTTR